MGFMDELRKLTQPIDDDDDFYPEADTSLRQTAQPSAAQLQMESAFTEETEAKPEPAVKETTAPAKPGGGLFAGLGARRANKPKARERVVEFNGQEQQVILFNPKTFNEASNLVSHLEQNRSVVMTLEGVPNDSARRLLDFISGITFALKYKITPISAKTYFVAPENVDLLGTQAEPQQQPEADSQY